MAYETIIVETRGKVGLITLEPAEGAQRAEFASAGRVGRRRSTAFDADPGIGAIVLTGSEKAFAAGADIKEMQAKTLCRCLSCRTSSPAGTNSARVRKPIIAAVAGYALGGGCELAMMCDFIIAADNAKFGQPEITLGVMPGMGGSQRLTRFVGKSKAMDMCLTGRMMDAAEAERSGLVSRVVPAGELLDEALKAAAKIAEFSLPAVMMAKEAVNRAYRDDARRGPALRDAGCSIRCSRSTTRRKAWRPSSRSARRISRNR